MIEWRKYLDDDRDGMALFVGRDDQGDFYVGTGGEYSIRAAEAVRLCGPNGGGAATKNIALYSAINHAFENMESVK